MASRSVNDLYNFFLYVVRKERGVFVTVSQFNQNMDAGQLDAVAEWFEPYGVDQKLHDALRQLRTYQAFTSDSGGFVSFPSNYLHLLGSPFTVSGSTVTKLRMINEDEFADAMRSQLRPVSNSYPIAVDSNVGFSIYPQSTQTGAYWYLRRPAQITLVVTQVGRVLTYDSTTSVQPEFSDIYLNNIIAKALRYAGVNMDEKGVSDFANQYNQETK